MKTHHPAVKKLHGTPHSAQICNFSEVFTCFFNQQMSNFQAIWQSHMAKPYGKAIWQSHMAMPYGNAIWHCHMDRQGRDMGHGTGTGTAHLVSEDICRFSILSFFRIAWLLDSEPGEKIYIFLNESFHGAFQILIKLFLSKSTIPDRSRRVLGLKTLICHGFFIDF